MTAIYVSLFGRIVWPSLVDRRFLTKVGRPSKDHLRMYRRYLESVGAVKL